ncbi:hypothetical protein [Streptomyces sp. MS2.AVA.5]|uniref:Uncharacterized protein n=1 Tax=Streptomyces achmelvichensis TaxID=3134111 RepID=A0ACC6PKT6_9ACTN
MAPTRGEDPAAAARRRDVAWRAGKAGRGKKAKSTAGLLKDPKSFKSTKKNATTGRYVPGGKPAESLVRSPAKDDVGRKADKAARTPLKSGSLNIQAAQGTASRTERTKRHKAKQDHEAHLDSLLAERGRPMPAEVGRIMNEIIHGPNPPEHEPPPRP